MNIVIVGAGEIGRYLAIILSKEEHNIILIDNDMLKVERVSQSIDVAVRYGSGTDWQLLDDLFELAPDLMIAVTDNDEINLVSCSIAKQLGYPKTIARVRDNRFLNRTRLDFGRIFDVDYFVGPELLVANDIFKFMMSPGSIMVENFAHGAVQLRTIKLPERWRKAKKSLKELEMPHGVMIGLIERETAEKVGGISLGKRKVIFPHGNDCLLPGDEVTLIGETAAMSEVHHYFGITTKPVKSAMIMGGSLTAINLAKLLEQQDIQVTVVERDFKKCTKLAEILPNSTVINQDGTDIDFLKAEKVAKIDVFSACTKTDEVNLLAAMLAKEVGCQNAVCVLANAGYGTLAQQMGVSYTASPRVSATSHILSQILSGTVRTLVSLYNNQAEILEVNVSMESSIVGIPLCELGPLLPPDFLIAMIQNRGRIMIAHGNRIISAGDSVIVITSPKHINDLSKIF